MAQQDLVLFDLDNTLLAGDSDYSWSLFLIGEGLLDEASHQARNEQFYDDYKNGCLDIDAFLQFQLAPLAQHSRQQLDTLHAKFMETVIQPMMTEKAQMLVNKHQAEGALCMIITATNSFVTGPIATAFGIEHLIGTEPEIIDGEFTGNVSGLPSFQAGKVTRLNAWLEARGQQLSDFSTTYFYSDSHNDLPLMKLVEHPVAVDADPQLTAHAKENGWPAISLR